MYNILINNLSTFPMNAQMNNYLMCVDEWEGKPNSERTFQGLQTNEPVTHALIRKFANEERGEKLNKILSLATEKVRSDSIFPEDKPKNKELVNLLAKYLYASEAEIVKLKHYTFYEEAVKKFTIDEYADDTEEGVAKNIPAMEFVEITDIPSFNDIQTAVVEMATKIIDLYDHHNNECHFFMDYTGGDRTTSTIMIALTKMLEERDIKINHIWAVNYDPSVEIKEIHEKIEINYIFDFISGLYEFTNYGRADKLNEFWEESKIPLCKSAKNVNDKISALAESIQLCRAENIVEGIGGLVKAIENYEKNIDNSEHNELFQYLIKDIKNNYNLIYNTRQRTVPNIVRWCLDKNLVQQAVTIYTELFPEYIVKERILWYKGTLPDVEYIQHRSEQAYNYINTYLWKTIGNELNYEWSNQQYARSCKNKTEAIINYIFINPSNLTFTKEGISSQRLKELLSNYYIFKAMIRNLINHASNRKIKLSNVLKNMTFNDVSKFKDVDGKYISELTTAVVKNIMYDMLEQLCKVVG